MHCCFFLESDLSCGLFCIQGVCNFTKSRLMFGMPSFFIDASDHFLQAYASLSPTVHIVNVQSAGKESHANITVCSIPKPF